MTTQVSSISKKRRRSDADDSQCHKRQKIAPLSGLFNISDEILLRTFSYLTVAELAITARVSHRFRRLSDDRQLWKEKYYDRWVRPRVLRIPQVGTTMKDGKLVPYSSKRARWLNERHLLHQEQRTDWKRQFRIRTNWWRGTCKIRNLELSEPQAPSVHFKSHRSIIFTAEAIHGLQAWSTKSQSEPLASLRFAKGYSPTTLNIDASYEDSTRLAVGFECGTIMIVEFYEDSGFTIRHSKQVTENEAVSAIAIAQPYILTMTHNKVMNLYSSQALVTDQTMWDDQNRLSLLASLQSESVHVPLALSIRQNPSGITASVAYCFSHLNFGWHIGMQELRLSPTGAVLDSRLSSSIDSSSGISIGKLPNSIHNPAHFQLGIRPTSLSYSHPYLLATIPDNTLQVYLVTSDMEKLHISAGRHLFGHTSGVSGAVISDRGKAVSVSSKGHEIRIWELEDAIMSAMGKKTSTRLLPAPEMGLVAEAIARRGNGLGLAVKELKNELASRRSLVGFDDEQIVVLGEFESGKRQILSCYDFT